MGRSKRQIANSGFIYIWYDRKHKRFYIGSHWGTETDGYICSSRWMNAAYRRRPTDFKRRIIKNITGVYQDLLNEEQRWLNMIKREEIKIRYYNLNCGKIGHWAAHNEYQTKTIKERMSNSLKKKWQDPEFRERNIKNSTAGRIEYWKSDKGIAERKRRSEEMLTMPERHPTPMSTKQREHQKSSMRKWWSIPENYLMMQQNTTSQMKDPKYREICGNSMRGKKWSQERRDMMTKHGHAKKNCETPTYKQWKHMKYTYGDHICPQWNDFTVFLYDMGEVPKGNILMRSNEDMEYSRTNCTWKARNQRIKKTTKFVEYNGEMIPLSECARKLGFNTREEYARFNAHIRRGKSVEETASFMLNKATLET